MSSFVVCLFVFPSWQSSQQPGNKPLFFMDDQMADLALKDLLLQNALPFLGQRGLRPLGQQSLCTRRCPPGDWAVPAAPRSSAQHGCVHGGVLSRPWGRCPESFPVVRHRGGQHCPRQQQHALVGVHGPSSLHTPPPPRSGDGQV